MTDTGNAAAGSPDPEDVARANLYGLIGRLFYAPPDPNLLAEISRSEAGGEGGETGLVGAWQGKADPSGMVAAIELARKLAPG